MCRLTIREHRRGCLTPYNSSEGLWNIANWSLSSTSVAGVSHNLLLPMQVVL
jgi:hypothetical protein